MKDFTQNLPEELLLILEDMYKNYDSLSFRGVAFDADTSNISALFQYFISRQGENASFLI